MTVSLFFFAVDRRNETSPQRHDSSKAANSALQNSLSASILKEMSLLGCLRSQPHARCISGMTCSDSLTRCHTETLDADQTYCLTSPGPDPMTPGVWHGGH